MTPEQKREYQREWYNKNLEKNRENNLIRYHKNKHKYLEKKKISNAKNYKPKQRIIKEKVEKVKLPKPAKVKKVKPKKEKIIVRNFKDYTITTDKNLIMEVLRNNLKSNLWNKNIKNWTDADWAKFNKIKR